MTAAFVEPASAPANAEEKTILVECRYVIPVRVPADWDEEQIRFVIEENSCPGTSWVARAFHEIEEQYDKEGYCWACSYAGANRVIAGAEPHQCSFEYGHTLAQAGLRCQCGAIEFFDDGHVDVERFRSSGDIRDESELDQLWPLLE